MATHFMLMVLFSGFVSLVFALLMRDAPKEQLRFGAMIFGGFVGVGVLLSWLMFPWPI